MTILTRKRGDTYADEFTVKSEITGEAIDISGYSFLLTLNTEKNPVNEDDQVYQLTGSIVDAENGIVGFSPSAVEADLVGTFYYDVQLTDPSGKIRTIEKDKYKYVQDITK